MAEGNAVKLPEYRSHKKVWAAKVTEVVPDPNNDEVDIWRLDNGGYIYASEHLKSRGAENPVGGYYVRYENGFESWSPAKAFEGGYTRIHGDSAPDLFIWMQNWLRAYAEHHEGFDADEVMNWILQQPMTTA